MMLRFLRFAVPTLLCTSTLQAQVTLHVDADRPSGGTGVGWSTAFNDLQDALAVADTGDLVIVAQGTYTPTSTTDRTISFEVPRGVIVEGGYAGFGESDPYLRDFRNQQTILSGDLGSVNSYHVVVTGESGPGTLYARINGFHITSGVADGGNTNHHDRGGGVKVEGLTKIINCYFYDNEAEQQGGAINSDQKMEIINCIFINNRSDMNGGAVCLDESPDQSILNSVFNNNYAEQNGGAVYSTRHVDGFIDACTFVHNKCGGSGSAVYGNYESTSSEELLLRGCIIYENRASTTITNNQVMVSSANPSPPYHDSVRVGKSILEDMANHYPGVVGANNQDADPLFRDQSGPNTIEGDEDDDLRLSGGSPAIDSGFVPIPADVEDVDDDGNLTEPTPDLDGHHRIVGAITDQGAFETPCVGDIYSDLNVDVSDLFLLLANWGACSSCPPYCVGDLTNSTGTGPDCDVNVSDLFLLLASWGNCQTGEGLVPESVSDCLEWYETGSQAQLSCLEAFQKMQEEE